MNAQARVLRNAGQVSNLGRGVYRAGLGCLGEAQHGGLHAVHVSDLAVHCGLQLVGVDLGVFPTQGNEFGPPVKNSGAPHSSLLIWLSRWHNTLPHGGVSAAKLNAFAAEPVETGSRSTSQSKISLKRRRALKVQLSVP